MSHQFENECDKQSLSVEGNVVTQSSEQTTKDNELFTSGDNLHDNNKVIPFGNIIRNSDDRTMINDVINIPLNIRLHSNQQSKGFQTSNGGPSCMRARRETCL